MTWVIDLDAESFEDAARLAREIQLGPDSLATHFIVRDADANEREVETNPSRRGGQASSGVVRRPRHNGGDCLAYSSITLVPSD